MLPWRLMHLPTLPDPKKVSVAQWSALKDREPTYACVANVDLVVVRYDDQVSVLYGRCLHRGALMSDAKVVGEDLICGLHQWDYRLETGVSAYDNKEALQKFTSFIDEEADTVYVDANEVEAWALPLGSISRMIRSQSTHSPGFISTVGLGTFVDPDVSGGAQNEAARSSSLDSELVSKITIQVSECTNQLSTFF